MFIKVYGKQFNELPMMEQVFSTLDLDVKSPQTLVLDQNEDKSSLSFVNYSEQLTSIEKASVRLANTIRLNIRQILYFNPKHDGDVTISNYAQSSSVKVLVGPDQLDEFFNKFVFHGRIQYNVDELQNVMDKIESFN